VNIHAVQGHPFVAACKRRWSVICCCWSQALEHSAWETLHLRRLYWCFDEN